MRKPYDFLVMSFNLLLNPSTIPAEMAPSARNQLRISSRLLRSDRAIFFILLHRLDFAAHCAGRPGVEEFAGPGRAGVFPEPLEVLAHQMTSNAFEVVVQKLLEFHSLFLGEVLRTLQQHPATAGQMGLVAVLFELLEFAHSDSVNGLVDAIHDMKAVQHLDGMTGFLANYLEVSAPHVAADKLQSGDTLLAQEAKESQQCFGLAIGSDPRSVFKCILGSFGWTVVVNHP